MTWRFIRIRLLENRRRTTNIYVATIAYDGTIYIGLLGHNPITAIVKFHNTCLLKEGITRRRAVKLKKGT